MLLAFAFASLAVELAANDADVLPKPTSIKVWTAKLHKLEHTRPRPSNAAGVVDAVSSLEARVRDACDKLRVKFTTSVHSFYWRDGTAIIYTEEEVKKAKKASSGVARITRRNGFSVHMSRSDASQIKKGTRLRVDAYLRFYKGLRTSSDKYGYAMYSVYVPSVRGSHQGVSGTCCTTDYTLELGRTELDPLWITPGGPLRAKEENRLAANKGGEN